jgi:NADH:ubiquinone oxidoreductase subunit 4 (subunit M)
LILGWGGPRREAAAWRIAGYWGLAALLVAVMAMYGASGRQTATWTSCWYPQPRMQLAVGVALIVAAARDSLLPFHGWARDVLGAPVSLDCDRRGFDRLGGYVLLRVLGDAEPVGAQLLSPLVAGLAAITVVYAASSY